MESSGLYKQLLPYVLSKEELQAWGYPVPCADPRRVFIRPSTFESDDMSQQKCRCNQTVSLCESFWYEGRGCFYHPLRVKGQVYACCGRDQNSRGCTKSPYHVSSYIMRQMLWEKANSADSVEKAQINANVFGLDCEFVYTTYGMEIARVSLVSAQNYLIFDDIVRPVGFVLDYNTQFSGITEDHYRYGPVFGLSYIQAKLKSYIDSETILIGHALNTDLLGLHFMHDKVIDTSVLFPHKLGNPYRLSLKYLASKYLGVSIHDKETGHDSVEDAIVCTHLLFSNLENLPNQSARKNL